MMFLKTKAIRLGKSIRNIRLIFYHFLKVTVAVKRFVLPARVEIMSTKNVTYVTEIAKLLLSTSLTFNLWSVVHFLKTFHQKMKILGLRVSMDTEIIFCG